MNEVKLSNNLSVIEQEINAFHELGSRSVWEIGKRLNHVKENDLTHGEFGNWLNKIGMNHNTANRYMKINRELNYDPSHNLGFQNLYHIATLPEEEREKEHVTSKGEIKTVDEMTVRELEEVKRKNREQQKTIEEQQKIINEQANQKPKVIEKEVTKEVIPYDYDGLKSDNQQLSGALKEAQRENKRMQEQVKRWTEQRKEVDEKSQKYDQLTEAIEKAEGQLNTTQKMISDYKNINEILRKSNEFLAEASALVYTDIDYALNRNGLASQEFDLLVERLERFLKDLRAIKNTTIIEGEFTNV